MGGNVERVKERLSIVEVAEQYLKLEKTGNNWKAKCPFHNEKTASFFISSGRNTYYCFGCGAKGDIFTLTQELEGVDFKEALRLLADKAGVTLVHDARDKKEEQEIRSALEGATNFFVGSLVEHIEAKKYLSMRGLNEESIKEWRLGYAPDTWRSLSEHLLERSFDRETLIKAGLIKSSAEEPRKEPYDVFRNRLIFPIFDPNGRVIAFSGRGLGEVVPKYLNSPDTLLFQKSEVLYGLDKAKDEIRRKNYAILVEGQIDLVLSHQVGVRNAVASSGTAFTAAHLDRLRRLSPRIILAFDPDEAGRKAAEKSAALALSLGMDVKIARLPDGQDPADLIKADPDKWKQALRDSKHAIEVFVLELVTREKDPRKLGMEIERRILPLVSLISSSIERSHFVSFIARHSGIKEEVIWDDVKKIKVGEVVTAVKEEESNSVPLRTRIKERMEELALWKKDLDGASSEYDRLIHEEEELAHRLSQVELEDERTGLKDKLNRGEGGEETIRRIEIISKALDEKKRKVL